MLWNNVWTRISNGKKYIIFRQLSLHSTYSIKRKLRYMKDTLTTSVWITFSITEYLCSHTCPFQSNPMHSIKKNNFWFKGYFHHTFLPGVAKWKGRQSFCTFTTCMKDSFCKCQLPDKQWLLKYLPPCDYQSYRSPVFWCLYCCCPSLFAVLSMSWDVCGSILNASTSHLYSLTRF